MQVTGFLGSNKTPYKRKFQVGETMATAGVPVVVAGAGAYGVKKATTTAGANMIGITLDAVTTVVVQQSDNSDPSRFVNVIVNSDALVDARLCGGATSGTALSEETEVTGDSTGLIADSTASFTNFDEGGVFWSTGANRGPSSFRKIITGDATNADVGVPWPVDPVIGDKFVLVPFSLFDLQYVQLTTLLDEVDVTAAVDTDNANLIPFEIKFPANFSRVLTDTHILMTIADHLYASS